MAVSNNYKFEDYQITELDNGLKIISESIPHFRSISLGFWIPAGSRNENPGNNGITHLIEHLLFKGTKKRSYRDIAVTFDSLGAEFNAFTDKENSCVYADFIDTHLDQCLEILFDVLMNPSFLPENIKLEKKVIAEEIKMVRDNPSDIIFNHFYKIIFNNHPLSLFILGTHKSLKKIDSSSIRNYFDTNFNLNGIVLSAAGNIDHDELVCKVRKNTEGYVNENNRIKSGSIEELYRYSKAKKIYKSNMKSNYLCYGSIGCSRRSKDRYPLSLFTNILGGSMSSRLFQKIREEKGLAYTVFASNSQYSDAGVIVIYSATSNTSVNRILDLINTEIKNISKRGLSESELEIAKENTKGNIVLGVEDISSRMFRLGKALLMDGRVLTIDEILKRIDKVRMEEVNDIVNKYFQIDKMSTVIIGKEKVRRPK